MTNQQNAREQGRIILAHGEVTGHCHEVVTTDTGLPPGMDEAQFFTDPTSGSRVLMLLAPAELRHEEHARIQLDPSKPVMFRQGDVLGIPIGEGMWEIRRQEEKEPEGWRQVAD